jgi:hypothetical protein
MHEYGLRQQFKGVTFEIPFGQTMTTAYISNLRVQLKTFSEHICLGLHEYG